MASKLTNHKIHNIFSSFPPDTNFFWFNTEYERYVGRLSLVGDIIYNYDKKTVASRVFKLHADDVKNIVIFPESSTSGLPDALSPVFIGSEWVGEWNAVE